MIENDLNIDYENPENVIDSDALNEVKNKIEELQYFRENAREMGDEALAQEYEQEIDELMGYASSSTGLGGKIRSMTTTEDKAYRSVKNCINRAYRKLKEEDSELEEFLSQTIITGKRFSYNPDRLPKKLISWKT